MAATWALRRAGEAHDTLGVAMTLEAFAPSQPLTLGVELELQLLSTHDYDLDPLRRPTCCA